MTTAIKVDHIAKPEPARDRWGRYLIPTGPKGGLEAHTRATTIARGLDDTYGLERWQMAQVANGLGRKPALIKLARNHPDYEPNKTVYREIVDAALEASDSADGRRAGTALHKLTERWDLGLLSEADLVAMDRDDNARLMEYQAALRIAGLEIHPEHAEEILVINKTVTIGGIDYDWKIAGTADRIVTLADGRRVIADLKTSKNVDHGQLAFAVQLAIYANHTHVFDAATGKLKDRIDVDRTQGIIIHLPSQGEVSCQLYTIDLELGFRGLMCAMERRDLQALGRDALQAYRPTYVGTGGSTAQRDWLAERIQRIISHDDQGAANLLVSVWEMTDVPMPLPQTLTSEHIECMDNVLFGVEGAYELAFPLYRPGTQPKAVPPKASTAKGEKSKCPHCGKLYVNLQRHVDKVHAENHPTKNKEK